MGTIDFLYGPGCSVDLVCRLPTMCINTDVPCLANGSLQKEEGGGGERRKEGRMEPVCVQGSSQKTLFASLELMGICVSRLGMTTVCLHNMHCI